MRYLFARVTFAALVALASIPSTASTAAAASPERASVIDIQYRPVHGCSPVQAVQKARWAGLRNARVTNITPRRVVVSGRSYRAWEQMSFANVRGCPVLRR
jgi:hypothetical protein